MTEIQAKLLEILKAFDTVCRNHDAEYFLTGGSALGAIRHHGFIPWDDDIDVGMRREMWEKVRPFFADELPSSMVMVDYIDYEDYRNPIAKIIDTESTVLYRANLADGCPKGQYLEIFMHDAVPADKLAQHKSDFLTYCELMTPYFSVFHEKMNYKRGLKQDELEILENYNNIKNTVTDENRKQILADYVKKISAYSEEESDYLLLGWGVNCCYYPLENFDGVRYEKFEDMMVPVAARACDNLRIDYGNSWSDFPPPEAQVAHVTVGDEHIKGEVFMDTITKQINPEKTRAARLSQKDINIQMLPAKVESEKRMLTIKMKHAFELEKRAVNLKAQYDSQEYSEIVEYFDSYISLRKKANRFTFDLDLALETRVIIARSLVMLGRTSDAENVLGLPRNMFLRDAKNKTEEDILRITKANSYYYDGIPAKAIELLESVDDELKQSLIARKIMMRIGILSGEIADDIDNLLIKYPSDMELVKIKGDMLAIQGKTDEAEAMYDIVIAKSNNGMDIIDVKEKRANNA